MKRRNGLIATLAALFLLQAPLCALACMSNAAPGESATAAQPASCHEAVPNPGSSREPADAQDDCGCGDSYTAVRASAAQTFSTVPSPPVVPPTEFDAPLNAIFGKKIEVRLSEADLPPPDILRLKSTLLI